MSRERDYDRPREEAPAEPNPEFKCFIGGIPFSVDDGKLRDAFAEFEPVDAKVMMDRLTGRSRGFGFVWFRDKRGVDTAIERMHNSELDGRRISVAKAVPQSETAPGTPADLLRRGQPYPREQGRFDRGPRYGGRYEDRGYGGAPRDYRGDYRGGGYDRGYYGGYDSRAGYGYDSRAGYGGGYDRGGYGGYDYREPYGGGGGGYYGGYDQGRGAYEAYDDRYRGYGADRSHERGGRAGPYDRPPGR